MRKLAAFVFYLIYCGPALATDHLEPNVGILSDAFLTSYELRVRTIFDEAYHPDIRARLVVLPSFEPEEVIAIKLLEDKTYAIVTLRPQISMWSYESLEMMKAGEIRKVGKNGENESMSKDIAEAEKALPPNFRDVKIDRCESSIEQELAERILSVWKAMLLQTHFAADDGTMGLDGVTYYFSMPAQG